MLKTTVYLDADDYRRLKAMARAEGRTPAEMVREAVSVYARKKRVRLPKSVGLGRSGGRNLGERAEELLEGFGR